MKTIGIALIVIGLALTIYTGVTYFTTQKVADIGRIEITRDKPHNLSWPPFVGIIVLAVGGIVLWQSSKK